MSYQAERDQFVARMALEGLDTYTTRALLRAATTLNRYAELSCSSEQADRDRVSCPAATSYQRMSHVEGVMKTYPRKVSGPCLCDQYHGAGQHDDVPRIAVLEYRLVCRIGRAVPADWAIVTQGDPRGYVLRVIPPSYAERNAGRDQHNLDSIGVPNGLSGLRF